MKKVVNGRWGMGYFIECSGRVVECNGLVKRNVCVRLRVLFGV